MQRPVIFDRVAALRGQVIVRLVFGGAIILLVIVFHVAIGFMTKPPQWWYVIDTQKNGFFDLFVMATDVFIMPLLFFAAGYFTLPSLLLSAASKFSTMLEISDARWVSVLPISSS